MAQENGKAKGKWSGRAKKANEGIRKNKSELLALASAVGAIYSAIRDMRNKPNETDNDAQQGEPEVG